MTTYTIWNAIEKKEILTTRTELPCIGTIFNLGGKTYRVVEITHKFVKDTTWDCRPDRTFVKVVPWEEEYPC